MSKGFNNTKVTIIICSFFSVISTTFHKKDAASLIFTYNSANYKFDPINFKQFMNDVAFTASRFLRK